MTLERCALGTRLIDMQQKHHVYHSIIGRATHMFAKWMQDNWGYLIHDNIDFWVPYLAESYEAIKQKVDEHYNVQVDERPNSETHIDCVVIPGNRTGGRPMTPGKFPLLMQESFCNGWARVHGVKKQAIRIANGMAFDVTKGYSCTCTFWVTLTWTVG
jgi:hypothetical protein